MDASQREATQQRESKPKLRGIDQMQIDATSDVLLMPRGLLPDAVATEAARNYFSKHPECYASLRAEVVKRCASESVLERARSGDVRAWGYSCPRFSS